MLLLSFWVFIERQQKCLPVCVPRVPADSKMQSLPLMPNSTTHSVRGGIHRGRQATDSMVCSPR